jgi:hypothetical protein
MFSGAKRHILYRIGNAPLRPYPYAHLFLEGVFPDALYGEMRRRLPPSESYTSLADTGRVTKGAYRERTVLFFDDRSLGAMPDEAAAFWQDIRALLLDRDLMELLIAKFDAPIQRRFAHVNGNVEVEPEAYLVRDRTGYAIGPHTDAPHRLVSALFYIPADDRWRAHGTSLYVPKDRRFTCEGGPHYAPAPFERMATMDFVPNALFAFAKTDNSFHGVEAVTEEGIERDVILYDIRLKGRLSKTLGEAA